MNKIEFYKETEFKETPIGKIPKDWRSVKLREVAGVRGNKNISGFEKVAFIPMELISETKIYADYHVKASNEIKSYIYCEAGDILLAKITPSLENGKQGIVPFDIPNGFALATTEVFPIYCREIDRFFLFYILKFPKFRNKIIASMTGTTGRQRASKESVENLDIPFPPVVEQRAIAEVLSVVDLAVQRTDMVIAKTERLKKGLMQTLLTRGIGHKEFKDTEIGKIPKTWQIVKVEDILSLEYGEGLPERERIPGEYPVVGSNGIVGYHNKALVKGPGIVIGRKGTIGAVSWVDKDFWPIDTTYYVNLKNPDVFLKWLFYEMSHLNPAQLHLADVVPGLKRELVYQLKMPLPPLEEQQKIATILLTVDEKLESERKEKIRLEMIKRGLMDLLLTGKVRVKVG